MALGTTVQRRDGSSGGNVDVAPSTGMLTAGQQANTTSPTQKDDLISKPGPVDQGPVFSNTNVNMPNTPPPGPDLQDLYATGFDPALAGAGQVTDPVSAGRARSAGTSPGFSPVNVSTNPDINTMGDEDIDSQGYDAVQRQLSEDAKASEILNRITSQDSPLMQRAKQEGILMAASRGLQNSSIAAGTAMGAMVDRATPIAQQEAQNMTSMELANLDEANRALAFSAAAKNSASLAGAQIKSQEAQVSAGIKSNEALTSAQLTSQQKQLAAQISSQEAMFSAAEANKQAQFNANWSNQVKMLNAELAQQAGQFNASQQNAINSQIMQMNTQLNEQYLRGTQALDLATIQGQYQVLTTNNMVAGELFTAGMNIVGNAMGNENIDPGRIAAYVDISNTFTANGLSFIQNANTMNWEAFLPKTTTKTEPTLPAGAASATGGSWRKGVNLT